MSKKRWQMGCYLLIAFVSLLAVGGLFRFLYLYDNKYTYPVCMPEQGVLYITAEATPNLLVPLAAGWEFYAGSLLTPQDFITTASPAPADALQPAYIAAKSVVPPGSGTYRLRVRSDGEPQILCMELPEIRSVSAVWINGTLVAQSDELPLSSNQLYTKSSIEAFVLDGECEIIVQAVNFAGHYGGMLTPPMLGTPRAIDGMLFRRLLFYSFFCFSSITLALFSLAVWRRMIRDRLYRYFGIMTLCFAVSVSYPIWGWPGGGTAGVGYTAESLSSLAVMLCVIAINQVALGISVKNLFYRITLVLGSIATAMSVLFPVFILPLAPALIGGYTLFLDLCRLATCVFMIYCVINGIRSHPVIGWIITANMVYGAGLMMNVFTNNHFAPISGGWPTEYSGFAMVVLFAIMMIRYNQSTMLENDRLNAHLEDEVARRTAQIGRVLQERKRFLSGFAHDLKAPVSAIQTYMELIHMGHIKVDSELESYLKVIEQKSTDMQRRVEALQLFTAHDDGSFSDRERIELRAFLRELYQNNLPDAEASGIYFKLCLADDDAYIMAWRDKLTSALENIIYNAISFMPDGGILMVAMFCHDNWVDITISDTGLGISPEHLPHVFDEHFSTREGQAQDYPTFKRGLGLFLAQATIRELDGEITAYSDWGNGAEFNIQLPLVP